MEFYEMFEHVDEDFNIFKSGGIWMSHVKTGQEKMVKQSNIRYYLGNGWVVGRLQNV